VGDVVLPPAVVLCGGLGTRLRSVVSDRPKALAEVGGVPFLDVLLAGLERQGVRDAVLAAGYLGDQLRSHVESYEAGRTMRVQVVEEPAPLGTAGAIRFAQHRAGLAGRILALNGDTLFTGSIARLAGAHAAATDGRAVTLALVPPPGGDRFGRVALGADGHVTAFEEKSDAPGGWTNAGVYILEPEALSRLLPGEAASLERDVLPALVGRGLATVTYPEATFLDIGTPDSLASAATFLQTHPLP
jgi:NDP-sugar pyrophosphorylase family protein